MTIDVIVGSWETGLISSSLSLSVLACASLCKESLCNSFKFSQPDSLCQLANLSYLEDPDVGETPVTIMISEAEVEGLKLFCRGGENCCGKESNRLCAEGEDGLGSDDDDDDGDVGQGDCDHDDQCSGLLQCGTDNCATKSGGLWDESDDCCQV